MKKHNREEQLIREIMKDDTPKKAPKSFSASVMNRIALEPLPMKNVYEPLITRKGWIILLVVLISTLIGLFLVFGDSQGATGVGGMFGFIGHGTNQLIDVVSGAPIGVIGILFGLSGLLLFDRLLSSRAKKVQANHTV
ncbi:hypothetical protein EYV94_06555 [Puteibacter caeruleilacunae]|nr:hypothetical protein EYV94_06555 [Puteibacter caeruleilacunae]